MKFEPEVARDVLLHLEDNLFSDQEWSNEIDIENLYQALYPKHMKEDILYAARKLYEDDYITGKLLVLPNGGRIAMFKIYDITMKGHEFIANTTDPDIWEKVYTKAKNVGISSMSVLGNLAFSVVQAKIQEAGFIQGIVDTITK